MSRLGYHNSKDLYLIQNDPTKKEEIRKNCMNQLDEFDDKLNYMMKRQAKKKKKKH